MYVAFDQLNMLLKADLYSRIENIFLSFILLKINYRNFIIYS